MLPRLSFIAVFAGVLPAVFATAEDAIRFDRDIAPILSDKCVFCHGPDEEHREADLRLDIESSAKESAIVAGDVEASEFVTRILSSDADSVMPPADAHKELSSKQKELLTRWVREGAEWTQHWSFAPPKKSAAKETPTHPWSQGTIDDFVLAKLKAEKLKPRDEASREKLIRRLSFDLTGLPPSLAEVDAFVADASPKAYENLVDRLLQSDHFGERMALMWLDAARYGDTSVFHADGPRDMWAWRDAVVKAYNDNMPFDQFSIMQLAGDLIPDAPVGQKILAGFNRNNATTDEGGAIAEEYRVEYVVDRVKTTSTVWLGLTMECAQCHDHKYDPISQEEYYKFFAFFNVSADGGMQTRKGNATPMLDIPNEENLKQLPGVQSELVDAKLELEKLQDDSEPEFQKWLTEPQEKSSPSVAGAVVQVPLLRGKDNLALDLLDPKRKVEIKGGTKWVKSRADWGLKFTGREYVEVGAVADFEKSDSFSYGGWVKPIKGGGGAVLAKMDDHGGHRGYDMLVGGGQIQVHIINTWPTNAIKVKTKKRLKNDDWAHIFATYDGTGRAEGIKIYVNGENWKWDIEQDGLTDTIKTKKTLLIGSRHPGSRFKGEIDSVQIYDRCLKVDEVKQLSKEKSIDALLAVDADNRSDQLLDVIRQHYLSTQHKGFQALTKKVSDLTKREAELKKPLTSVMVMGDMEKPRETFVLTRGAYDSPSKKKVTPDTLAVLPPMNSQLPKNRLGLARWLFQDDNPLTARVAVNRYWQLLFGHGLVSTTEDFGAQGDFPSHPDLLDYLAVDFRESEWNIKRMIKQIVMSATYRQSSIAESALYKLDPNNRLLGRGPRFRLQGEFIRDTALDLGNLLIKNIGGPGVKPYQPPGLWKEVGLGGNPKFVQDHGEKLYRRSIYTYWKGSAPPPSMMIFDAPTREKCTMKRPRTNTPLQALVTLNDTQFVEAARNFAQRIMATGGDTTEKRIEFAFRLATARTPRSGELDILKSVYESALSDYREKPEAAKELLSIGESKRDEKLDAVEHAAWSILASTILNLDETLVRE